MNCPNCERPIAMARASCLYCGAALSADLQEQAASAAKRVLQSKSLAHLENAARGADAAQSPRRHCIIETKSSTVEAIASACSVSLWEAGQWQAASNYRLLKVTTEPAGGPQETLLREKGVRFFVFADESLAGFRNPIIIETIDPSSAPLRCLMREDPDQPPVRKELHDKDIALILTGTIKREKVKDRTSLRNQTDIRLEDAWLAHIHLKTGGRPLELDPRRAAFEGPGLASAHMRAIELVRRLATQARHDDSFKNVVPALAPGSDPLTDLVQFKTSQKTKDKEPKMVVLDNVAQFREFSAWRGAIEVQLLNQAPASH